MRSGASQRFRCPRVPAVSPTRTQASVKSHRVFETPVASAFAIIADGFDRTSCHGRPRSRSAALRIKRARLNRAAGDIVRDAALAKKSDLMRIACAIAPWVGSNNWRIPDLPEFSDREELILWDRVGEGARSSKKKRFAFSCKCKYILA